MPAQLPMKVQW